MRIHQMKRSDFDRLPHRKWDEEVICASIVVLPQRVKHDSGYRCMDFVAVDENSQPICRLSGCSDVVHIDGIGGYGEWSPDSGMRRLVVPRGWSIDCLPASGLLRLFSPSRWVKCDAALSSFEIYSVPKEQRIGGAA